MSFVIVFLGAGLGGLLRHAVNVFCLARGWLDFPYATLFVNVVGSFCMGCLAGAFAGRHEAQLWKLFLGTGVLGGFTTFSTFSLDLVGLLQRGELLRGAAYLCGSVIMGALGLLGGARLLAR